MIRKLFLLLSLAWSVRVFAAADTVIVPVQRQLFHEQIQMEQNLLDRVDGRSDHYIKISSNDEINLIVTNTMFRRINGIVDTIELNNSIPGNNEKIRYLRYVRQLVKAYREGIRSKELNPVYAQLLVNAFEKAMNASLAKMSMASIINALPYESGNIITEIFNDSYYYNENKKIVFQKYCQIHPDKIIQRLEPYINEPFADSMVTLSSRYNPTAIYTASQASRTAMSQLIRRNNNPLVQLIVALTDIKGALMFFPFLDDLLSGKKTIGEIKKIVGNSETGYNNVEYYKLLVKTEIDYFRRMVSPQKDTPIAMFGPNSLRETLKQVAIQYFVTPINQLHNEPNLNTRMKSTDPLSPVELYYAMVMGESDIYTSSFVNCFKRMIRRMGSDPRGDSLFIRVNFDYFRKFIKLTATFNQLDDFLKTMPLQNSALVMQAFVAKLNKTGSLEDAVDIADAYSSITNKKLLHTILGHIIENENTCIEKNDAYGKMIYGLLKDICRYADSASTSDLSKVLGIPSIFSIDKKKLQDDSSRIIQQVFFFGDDDGKDDFKGFINSFPAESWKVQMKEEWVEIRSIRGQKILIYANLPLDNTSQMDDSAQIHLGRYLLANDLHPSIVIHRGHSYFLPRTLQLMPYDLKLVILGSCGGYRNLNHVLKNSPDAQIISTKETGKVEINKAVINYMNQVLLAGKSLEWKTMWAVLTRQFASSDDKTRLSWNDYIPPYRNLGAIFLKAYNQMKMEKGY